MKKFEVKFDYNGTITCIKVQANGIDKALNTATKSYLSKNKDVDITKVDTEIHQFVDD